MVDKRKVPTLRYCPYLLTYFLEFVQRKINPISESPLIDW